MAAFKTELRSVGFKLHEEVEPTESMELVGRILDGRRRRLLPRPRRMWRLWWAITEILSKKVLAPSHMRKLVGHLVDHFATRRELLSGLGSVYEFIGDGCECGVDFFLLCL